MCYNCGCKRKDDQMGSPDNITLNTIAKAATAMGMNGEDTLKNMKELLNETTGNEIDVRVKELNLTQTPEENGPKE